MNKNQRQPAPSGGAPKGPAASSNKAAVLERLQQLKARAALAALLSFGVLSGLAAGHTVGVTSNGTTSAAATTQPAASSNTDNGGFFDQGGSDAQGGFGFGGGNANQAPVASSGVS